MLPMVQSEPVLFKCGVQSVNTAVTPPTTLPPSLTPESDVDELVDIFFDVDVAATTYPRIESCDLQLGDTWRGMQGKMSVTSPDKKIRKKSDKPQSQINKCYNEKRRREQENETINQLEELLWTCLAEVKQPDKNGIVREATRQIKEVLNRRLECPDECPLRVAQALSPVQAGEVSSTQPHPPCSGIYYTELTSLIETLKHYTGKLGWILLEINAKGEIECVTENIKDLIQRDRSELYKKSIFSVLHVKDHAKIRPLLRSVQNFNWTTGEIDKFQAIHAGLIVKNSNGTESSVVEAVIHAAPVRGSASEEAGSVMCVIRRCEDASAALIPVVGAGAGSGPPHLAPRNHADHIVFRLDIDNNYTILSCDLSGVENFVKPTVSPVGGCYLDLVESVDRASVSAHLAQAAALPAPPAVSEPFRLRLAPDRAPLRVSARSRLFRVKPSSGEPDFIMSTHSVLSDDDAPEQAAPAPASAAPAAQPAPAPAPNNGDQSFSMNDFDLEPWAATLLAGMPDESKERKEAGESSGEAHRPHAPLAHHVPHEEPTRLRSILTGKNHILIGILRQEEEEGAGGESPAPLTPHTPHAPLTPQPPQPPRTPHALLAPQTSHAGPSHAHQQHNPLVRILNDNTDDEGEESRRNAGGPRPLAHQHKSVLSQLLQPTNNGPSNNGRPDNAEASYLEKMTAQKRKFEESKGMAPNAKRATPENQQVSSSAVPTVVSAAPSVSPATSGGGMSPLCQKNQILVSLLAREQSTPTTPPVLNPGVRPYPPRRPLHPPQPPHPHHPPPHHPQHHPPRHNSALSDILTGNNHRMGTVNGGAGVGAGGASGQGAGAGAGAGAGGSHLQIMLQQGGAGARYPPPHYPQRQYPHHHHQPQQHSAATSRASGGDGEVPNDISLSDILDDVLASMPDSDRQPEVSMRQRQEIEDRSAAVKAITESLMRCEKVSKHPGVSSPGTPPVYSVQSPVGGSGCSMGGSSGGGGPVYPQGRAPTSIAEHHARLLHMQRSQQMLVSPEAAEQPQSDLGSTINALVSETPPNVTLLPRGDYSNIYQTNQMGSNYGTIKITTSQQNSMLGRQLSVGGSGGYVQGGGAGAAHTAVHTPMTPQPYHRPPRPHLVGAYYDEGAGGDCGEYARCTPLPPHLPHPYRSPGHLHGPGNGSPGVAGGGAGGTSEYVRNELRAVVGARSARPDLHPLQPPDMDSLMSFDIAPPEYYGSGLGGGGGGGR